VVENLIARIPDAAVLAPLLGLLAGALLSLSPVSLPSIPVVVSALAPGMLSETGERHRRPLLPAFPAVLAFVAGMDGVLGILGLTIIQVAELLTRAAIVLHLLSAGLLAILGLRLLLRRTSLCGRTGALPPTPSEAFLFGVVFAVTGCPACGPIAIGVGAAAALVGGPALAFGVVGAFVLGRAVVLLLTAAVGARLLPVGTDAVPWRRLDVIVGALFLLAAAYYLYRVASGAVITQLPGEPGGPLP
jgi:cytochrome c biogenesis protein CcdA